MYAAWVNAILGNPIPPETEATCSRCVMAADRGQKQENGGGFFDPETLCCTYLPELPNFGVGRILSDKDPRSAHGRRTVEARMRRGVAVTPLGLGRSPAYALLYSNAKDGFGKSRSLRCPHHLGGGSCGIWAHRSSACATWFCKHSRGAVGLKFWRALNELLKAVEKSLAWWCVLESKVDARALTRLFPPSDNNPAVRGLDRYQLDEKVNPAQYAEVWGARAGHERKFFEECGRRVGRLGWPDVAAICGPEVQLLAISAKDAFGALLSRDVPPRLRVGDFLVHRSTRSAALVVSYTEYDPLSIPKDLMEALPYFDGRPVGEALRAIAREKKLNIDRDLIIKLTDFGILVPVQSES